jgi:hypothetical protein
MRHISLLTLELDKYQARTNSQNELRMLEHWRLIQMVRKRSLAGLP